MLMSVNLILLLAVAASQVDMSVSTGVPGAEKNTFECHIAFLGRDYPNMEVSHNNTHWQFCSTESNPDCLYLEDPAGHHAVVANILEVTNLGSFIHIQLPNIKTSSPCRKEVELLDEKNRTRIVLLFYNFGPQSVLHLRPTSLFQESQITVSASSNGEVVFTESLVLSSTKDGVFMDLSGCRSDKVVVQAGKEKFQPENCTNLKCDPSAVLTATYACGPTETCTPKVGCTPSP